MSDLFSNVYPTSSQEHFLKAALFQDQEKVEEHLRLWRSQVKPNAVDCATGGLFPLLYLNLMRLGIDHHKLEEFKNAYKSAWFRNEMMLNGLGPLIDAFNRNGIATLLLKGIPLTLLVYHDVGARLMSDIDLLVPYRNARGAIDLLIKLGWFPKFDRLRRSNSRWTSGYLRYRNSVSFFKDQGPEIDLHWHAFPENFLDSVSKYLWENAIPLEISGAKTLALCPEDQLLHVLIHGSRRDVCPTIRWISDSVHLIRKNPSLSWELLYEHCQMLSKGLTVSLALRYLRSEFEIEVPEAFLARTEARDFSWHETREIVINSKKTNLVNEVLFYLYRFQRLRRASSERISWLGIFRYLYYLSGVTNPLQLVPLVFGKVFRFLTTSGANPKKKHWSLFSDNSNIASKNTAGTKRAVGHEAIQANHVDALQL
ncbi:MAG: nucleotidyltransferase family protein [Deltaproteobacteria bacterium]|nr:nucleotidyltransferase family protein [Deltaproteobacteria bacterium]